MVISLCVDMWPGRVTDAGVGSSTNISVRRYVAWESN